MRQVALAEVKDDLSRFLRLAEPYRLEHHPEFLRRVADARNALKDGRGGHAVITGGPSPAFGRTRLARRSAAARRAGPEDTLRFDSLRLHEAGMITSSPQRIISQGTD